MTNEQIKAKELAELLNAFADGKQLQFKGKASDEWHNYSGNYFKALPKDFADGYSIRIKPETKSVPLTMQDLVDRVKENKTMWLSIGELILRFTDTHMYTSNGGIPYLFAFQHHYTFLDGTPCYKEVEDE